MLEELLDDLPSYWLLLLLLLSTTWQSENTGKRVVAGEVWLLRARNEDCARSFSDVPFCCDVVVERSRGGNFLFTFDVGQRSAIAFCKQGCDLAL